MASGALALQFKEVRRRLGRAMVATDSRNETGCATRERVCADFIRYDFGCRGLSVAYCLRIPVRSSRFPESLIGGTEAEEEELFFTDGQEGVVEDVVGDVAALGNGRGLVELPVDAEINPALAVFLFCL